MEIVTEVLLTFLKAFVVGGTICTIGQLFINFTKLTSGRILVMFMIAGLVLQTFGIYQYLVDFAGAGATVPISGFGYLIAKGAIKGAQEGAFGALTGGFIATAAGVSAAVLFGFMASLIFKARSKKD